MKQILLFLLIVLFSAIIARAEVGDKFTADGLKYKVTTESPNTVELVGFEGVHPSGALVIPAEVNGYSLTCIGRYAFVNCTGLNSVTIPKSVTRISRFAFYGCTGLTIVTIPEGVTEIGSMAFYQCSSLTSVTIPKSVTSIEGMTELGSGIFIECTRLTSVTLESNFIVSSGSSMVHIFGNQVLEYVIGDAVTSIGTYAFQGCTGLTSITIPEGVTSIGGAAFQGCTSLTSISIPEGVMTIGNYAFLGCTGLTSITIPESVTMIGGAAFSGCTSLTSISIPGSVTSLGDGAFDGTPWYDNQPDGLIYVGKIAYKYKGAMSEGTHITIKDGTIEISASAFYNCTGLTSVTIPESVTKIGSYALRGCKLRNVLVKCIIPPKLDGKPCDDQSLYHSSLYIPVGSWDAYAFDDNWYRFINIRETAMAEEQLNMQQAYTLMNASTFAYSVYDPVNDCIGTITSAGGINEDNPNHSWQMIESGGERYLYNLGARKFAKRGQKGLDLTENPTPIDMKDGGNGIVFGEHTSQQWAFVANESLSAEHSIVDAIASPLGEAEEGAVYDLSGRRVYNPRKGIFIRNGRKVAVK